MRRRDIIVGLALSSILSRAHAQQAGKVYRVAVVNPSVPMSDLSEASSFRGYRVFFAELRRLGFVEGQNLIVERFSAEGHNERYDALAREVVRDAPDVIVPVGPLTPRFKAATSSIPIVAIMADPVGFGIVADLAKPGGNITGVSTDAGLTVWAKRLQLLQEASPRISRLAFLSSQVTNPLTAAVESSAKSAGIEVLAPRLETNTTEESYRRFFADIAAERADGLIASDDASHFSNRQLIGEKLSELRLPAIFGYRELVQSGALMAYAFDIEELSKYMANAVARILNGTKPEDIPVYQITKFQLIINLKTAKSLGLTIPPSLLAQADDVVE